MESSALSLFPLRPAELVKPAASLSCQPRAAQIALLASANRWKTAEVAPM